MNIDLAVFHQTFFEEAADSLADLEGLLLRLEETPGDKELLNTIFRCAHSLKGGSATFGFTDIAHFTHGLETLLDKVRVGEIPVTVPLIQILLESRDQLTALLAVARGESPSAPDASALTARIEAAAVVTAAPSPVPAAGMTMAAETTELEDDGWGIFGLPKEWHLTLAPGRDVLRRGADPLLLISRLTDAVEIISLHCDTSQIPPLAEMDPESCYLRWEIEFRSDLDADRILEFFDFIADESEIVLTQALAPAEISNAPDLTLSNVDASSSASTDDGEHGALMVETAPTSPGPSLGKEGDQKAAPGTGAPALRAAAPAETHTLRVATDKVDKLINLVGELVINQSMLNEVVQDFHMGKIGRLAEAVATMERACRELQERVMAVRMLPIKHAFGRFPRLVRDLAGAVGKKIELVQTGEETELDKTVIESIADPLTHLVRNSIDHGLETPDERRAAGKSEVGTVALHAFHEGGNIVIEVSDDGKGLSRERILKKAVERGWLGESDPAPADDVLYGYIFQPGFSTAAAVTDLSGRGVGMDIVKQAVVGLGGSITLASTPGVGTRFRIRLPLTMAILEGLSLSVGEEVYILPLTSIVESIRPKAADLCRIAGQIEVVLVRGAALPVLRLAQVFGARTDVTDPTQGLLVIVENDGRKVALMVDELIGQSQVVIKSLEANYRKIDGIAGATILGDGRVALILDVPALVRGIHSTRTAFAVAA